MERGPLALFGAIVAVGVGPALWLGVQFGGVQQAPVNNRPAVIEQKPVGTELFGGSGAGAAPSTPENHEVKSVPRRNGEPIAKTKAPKKASSPSPSAEPEPSKSPSPSTSPDPSSSGDQGQSEQPSDPPTSDDPAVPPDPPTGDDGSGNGDGGSGGDQGDHGDQGNHDDHEDFGQEGRIIAGAQW
jgi:outer membrane biosynthesis protein TonB